MSNPSVKNAKKEKSRKDKQLERTRGASSDATNERPRSHESSATGDIADIVRAPSRPPRTD